MAIYDKFARFYDVLLAPLEKGILTKWRSEAFSIIPTGGKLLEIGAGTGANFPFYPASKVAVATEPSAKMLQIAVGKQTLNLHVQADAQKLPFAENSFDAVIGALVFCSIPDPAMAFAELRRVVRPGGMIVLLEHVRPHGLLGNCFDFLNLFTVALIDDHFNRDTALIAKKSGLQIIELKSKAGGIFNIITCLNNIQNDAIIDENLTKTSEIST